MARLDTGWHVNPKILQLGMAGMGLHAWSISYCDDALTDGFVPEGAWPSLPGVRVAVTKLVRAGLWVPTDGGYWLHDYTVYNRTRAHVESVRAAMRANGQAGGRASAVAKAQAKSEQTSQQTRQQKPTPGPGPGINPQPAPLQSSPASPASRTRAREGGGGFQHLGGLLPKRSKTAAAAADFSDLPDEVRERLSRPPIGSDNADP